MSDYEDVRKNDKSHINTLRFIVGILALFLLGSGVVTMFAVAEPEQQRISLPPQLKFGANITTGDIHPWEVYNFAGVIYQQLNLWRNQGEEDYEQNIISYRALLTPRYLANKHKDYKLRLDRGELKNRTRFVSALGNYSVNGGCGFYADRCVVSLGSGRWKVWIDVKIKEYQVESKTKKPYPIKDVSLRIPMLIVSEDDDSQYNPWGLKIDLEYIEEIEQIDLNAEDQKMESKLKEDEKAKQKKQREGAG